MYNWKKNDRIENDYFFFSEQWRQEAREHEKQMFSIFCGALSQCNAALNVLMKTRGVDHNSHHHIVESSSKNLDHRSSSSSGEDKSPAPHQDRNITENNTP